MTKKSAIFKFTIIMAITFISAFFALIAFKVPFTTTRWNSFLGGLNYSNDISDGIVAKYKFETLNASDDKTLVAEGVMSDIYEVLNSNYTEPSIAFVGGDTLKIQTGKGEDASKGNSITNVLSGVGGSSHLQIYFSKTGDVVLASDIESLSYKQEAGTDCLIIKLTKEGKEKFKNITSEAVEKTGLYYIAFNDSQTAVSMEVTEEVTNGKLTLTWADTSSGKAGVVATIINLLCEKNGAKLTYVTTDVVTATNGNSFGAGLIVALCAVMAVLLALFAIKFRAFAGLFAVALLFFTSVYSLLLNILPNVQVNVGGFVGILFAIIMVFLSAFIMLEKAKKENINGKKAKTALDNGFRKSVKVVLDVNISLIVALTALIFASSGALSNFAVCAIVGLVVNLFIYFVIENALFKSAIRLWGRKEKAFNFKKVVLKDENN